MNGCGVLCRLRNWKCGRGMFCDFCTNPTPVGKTVHIALGWLQHKNNDPTNFRLHAIVLLILVFTNFVAKTPGSVPPGAVMFSAGFDDSNHCYLITRCQDFSTITTQRVQ